MVRKGENKRQKNLYSSQETEKITSRGGKLEKETGEKKEKMVGDSLSWKKICRR